jgi:Fe2+ transport system protein B
MNIEYNAVKKLSRIYKIDRFFIFKHFGLFIGAKLFYWAFYYSLASKYNKMFYGFFNGNTILTWLHFKQHASQVSKWLHLFRS